MAVTYTKAQRDRAKREGLHLVTIAVGGMEFQGPATAEAARQLEQYLHEFLRDRFAKKDDAAGASSPPPAGPPRS